MRISDWSSDVCSSDLYERGITVSVGIIQGGTTVNVVPEHCQVNVDFRLPDPQAADELRAKVQGLKAQVADVELDVDFKLNRPHMPRTEGTADLMRRCQAFAARAGFTFEEGRSEESRVGKERGREC